MIDPPSADAASQPPRLLDQLRQAASLPSAGPNLATDNTDKRKQEKKANL